MAEFHEKFKIAHITDIGGYQVSTGASLADKMAAMNPVSPVNLQSFGPKNGVGCP
jgi:hypothetical protein